MRVRFPEGGVWQEFTCCRAEGLQVVPDGIALGQLAQSFINPPTAFCLLTRLVELPEGVHGGSSKRGKFGSRFECSSDGRGDGLLISEVRRESLIEPLKILGADEVVLSGSGWHKQVMEMTGGESVQLALNSIGGESALDQIRALGKGARR